jgi:hypothetical protein
MQKVVSAQVEAAIAKLPRQSNVSIEQVLANAQRLKIDALAEACREELRTRGSLVLTTADAERIAEIESRVADLALREVIEIAFREVPAKPEEILILRSIAAHPGTSYRELLKIYGRNDLSLVIGHLAYYRFGYFRPFLRGNLQSDLLLEREGSPAGVRYSLRPEALEAFISLGILGKALA